MSELVLGLDTSGALVTAAIGRVSAGQVEVLAQRSARSANQHAELLAPMIAGALSDAQLAVADLTVIAVGAGPGPFTGLRVGLVTARVLGLAREIPVRGVVSLDALALTVSRWAAEHGHALHEFLVATDARRREVYWAGYRGPEATRVTQPQVGIPADVATDVAARGCTVFGRGAVMYPELLGTPPAGAPTDVTGADVVHAYAAGLVVEPEPQYLRRPDAQVPGARKRVL